MRRVFSVVLVLGTAMCGGKPQTTPSPPSAVNAAGVWTALATTTSVTGGDCVGLLFQGAIGVVERTTLAVTQSGSDLNATSTRANGASCSYTGTADSSSMVLNGAFCGAAMVTDIQCQNGAVRDIRRQTSGINATVSGNTASGTTKESWNVLATSTQAVVGTMVIDQTFGATRQ